MHIKQGFLLSQIAITMTLETNFSASAVAIEIEEEGEKAGQHESSQSAKGQMCVRTGPIRKISVDIAQQRPASPESWGGAALSARGLDALQAIREAAHRTLVNQNSDASIIYTPDSSVSLPCSDQSPGGGVPRSRARRSTEVSGSHFRRPGEATVQEIKEGPLATSLLPLAPHKLEGLPSRPLRLPKKVPDRVPVHKTPSSPRERPRTAAPRLRNDHEDDVSRGRQLQVGRNSEMNITPRLSVENWRGEDQISPPSSCPHTQKFPPRRDWTRESLARDSVGGVGAGIESPDCDSCLGKHIQNITFPTSGPL